MFLEVTTKLTDKSDFEIFLKPLFNSRVLKWFYMFSLYNLLSSLQQLFEVIQLDPHFIDK